MLAGLTTGDIDGCDGFDGFDGCDGSDGFDGRDSFNDLFLTVLLNAINRLGVRINHLRLPISRLFRHHNTC